MSRENRFKPTKLVLYQIVPKIIEAYRLPGMSDDHPAHLALRGVQRRLAHFRICIEHGLSLIKECPVLGSVGPVTTPDTGVTT